MDSKTNQNIMTSFSRDIYVSNGPLNKDALASIHPNLATYIVSIPGVEIKELDVSRKGTFTGHTRIFFSNLPH
jgi:hypothetical protein